MPKSVFYAVKEYLKSRKEKKLKSEQIKRRKMVSDRQGVNACK